MDSVLQAASGLFVDLTQRAGQPAVRSRWNRCRCSPVVSQRCSRGHASRRAASLNSVAKLDIDLCDGEGNVCVSMRGFSSRVLSADIKTACVLVVPEWQAASATPRVADRSVHTRHSL